MGVIFDTRVEPSLKYIA